MLRFMLHSLKIATIVTTALLVALGGRWFYDFYLDREADPNVGRPVRVTIGEEDDADRVAAMLADRGLIRSELYFKSRLQLTGDQLQPGTYTLRIGMSTAMILDEITTAGEEVAEADGEDREVKNLEVQTIEGWRLGQIAAEVETVARDNGVEGFSAQAFLAAADEIENSQYEFLKDRPEDVGLEGYLFPSKYPFPSDAHPKDLIYYMLNTFDEQFTPDMRKRAREMGLTIHEVVTLASIVEREAAVEEERPIVAAVYLNRLGQDPPMPLGADPTVAYLLGDESDWWPELEGGEQNLPETDNPFNTYIYAGLPPGPICSPGIASITAVLYPDENNYLYFVAAADGSGRHLFAETFEEHQQNIQELDAAAGAGGESARTEG